MEKQKQVKGDDLKNYLERIRFDSVTSDPDKVFDKIRYRIEYGKLQITGVSPVWKYLAVAASLALLVVFSYMLTMNGRSQQIAYIDVKAIAGSKTKVVLPDNTIVWLNSNASIRYPQQFTARNREVEFSGEALFTVTPDKEKPFVVSMQGMKVQVLGTVFNIFENAETGIIETTLQEGKIAIYSGDNKTGKANLVLSPDEQVLYNRKNGEMEVRQVRATLFSSWVNGTFYFENNTLEEILGTLGRAYDVKMHLTGEALRNKRLTAQFTHQETLDEILSILQISAKYKYGKVKGEIYVTEK